MTRVRLVVTGEVEELALAASLQSLFPSALFDAQRKKHAFTASHRLEPVDPTVGASRAQHLIDEALDAGDADRVPGGEPFDFVVIVEDVELVNRPDPSVPIDNDKQLAVILDHVAYGVDLALAAPVDIPVIPKGKTKRYQRLTTLEARTQFLRNNCSFHLLCPMVEALFFAELAALKRAGAVHPSAFDPATSDHECFDVIDALYAAPGDGDTVWAKPTRLRHPKWYLTFLCDPIGAKSRPYKEKEGGKRALRELDWSKVLAHSPHASFARSLVADVADMLKVPVPHVAAEDRLHPLTRHGKQGRLRNIM